MPNSNVRDEYVVLKSSLLESSPSPLTRLSNDSNESNDSLRALEVSQGPSASSHSGHSRYAVDFSELSIYHIQLYSKNSPVSDLTRCQDLSFNATL